MKVRWTIQGKIMGTLCLLLYGAALTSQSGFLLLLIGILLACFAVNYLQSKKMIQSVQVNCPLGVQVCEGDKLRQPWKLINEGKQEAGMLSIESKGGRLFDVAQIPSGESCSVLPDLAFQKRGVYPYDTSSLHCRSPFGLLDVSRQLPLKGEVVVYPRIFDTPPPIARGYDVMVGGKFKGNRKSTSGAHFAGVRPFHDGDPLRQIHWQSSAKGQGLMVKIFDEELSGRIDMLVDTGRPQDGDQLDWLARAVGSLIFSAQDEGHQVELGEVQHEHVHMIPPFADGEEILNVLARLNPRDSELDVGERLSILAGRMSQRASICLLLADWQAAIEPLIRDWVAHKRAVSVYLPEGVPLPDLSAVKGFYYSAHAIRPA